MFLLINLLMFQFKWSMILEIEEYRDIIKAENGNKQHIKTQILIEH